MLYLVTGGAGFIGTHLSNTLVGAGHQVRVLDDMSFGDATKLHPEVHLIQGSIQDLSTCEKQLKVSMEFSYGSLLSKWPFIRYAL